LFPIPLGLANASRKGRWRSFSHPGLFAYFDGFAFMGRIRLLFAHPIWVALTGNVSFGSIPAINGVPVQRYIALCASHRHYASRSVETDNYPSLQRRFTTLQTTTSHINANITAKNKIIISGQSYSHWGDGLNPDAPDF